MYKVTVETTVSGYAPEGTESEILFQQEFETKKEADKAKRQQIKAFELTRHAGHVVNYSKGIELFTNY